MVLVFVGGAVGALLRYLITVATPPPYGPMVATLIINVVGAFALAVLMEVLVRRVLDPGRHLELRLLLRTGLLGGFTTYSALGLYSAELLRSGLVFVGVGYALATLVLGGVLSHAGGRLAGAWSGPTRTAT